MRLPLLQKIEIEEFDEEYLKGVFSKNYLGQIPTVLILKPKNGQGIAEIFPSVERAFKSLHLNANFPYPTYILKEVAFSQETFPEVKGLDNLPRHFIKKIKRIKKREQTLLSKAITYAQRIQNHALGDEIDDIQIKAHQNRNLRNFHMEKSFYLNLLEKMKGGKRQEEEV